MTDRPAMATITAILKEPWAITENALQSILEIAYRDNMDVEAVAAKLGRPLDNTHTTSIRNGTAIIPVSGPIFRHANILTQISGATSIESLALDFNAAMSDPKVTSIMLEIDSPGGEVSGTQEFAQMVADARGQKPIIAYAADACCSAAYWIASAADEIIAAETSVIGSIGVVAAVADPNAPDQRRKIQFVSSQSPNKRPDPNTESGKSQIQTLIDDLASVFLESVAANRGVTADYVQEKYGEGGVMVGRQAVASGLADRTGTYEGTLSELADKTEPTGLFSGTPLTRRSLTADEVLSLNTLNTTPTVIQAASNGDSAKTAQEARSKKYGIGIKDGGNVTKPAEFKGVADDDWADPVNYRYPVHDKAHADNAASRWGNADNRKQYNSKEQGIIGGRIKAAQKKFGSDTQGVNQMAVDNTDQNAEPTEGTVSAAAGSPSSTDVHVDSIAGSKGGKKKADEASVDATASAEVLKELAELRAKNDAQALTLAQQQASIAVLQEERDFSAAQTLVGGFITGKDAIDTAAKFYMALPTDEMKAEWIQREKAHANQVKDGALFTQLGKGPGASESADDPLAILKAKAKALQASDPTRYKSEAQAFDAVLKQKENLELARAYGDTVRGVK